MRNYVEFEDLKFSRGRNIVKMFKSKSTIFYKERWIIHSEDFNILEFECSLDFNEKQLDHFRREIYEVAIIKKDFKYTKTLKFSCSNNWLYFPVKIKKIYNKEG